MKIVLMVVGKTTDAHFEESIKDYSARIRHYVKFDLEVIPALKNTKGLSEAEQKEREGALIRQCIQPGDYVVLLDEHGAERRSMEFAAWMQKKMAAGYRRIVFLVGGPYGFSDSIHKIGAEEVSLSKMTFSHQMIRVLFTEQIYRAMTILHGEPYHHE